MSIDRKENLEEKLRQQFVDLIRATLSDNDNGMTQMELAQKLGCRQSIISRWLSGDRRPSLQTMLAARKKLGGMGMSEILEEVVGERQAGVMLSVADEDPDLFEALIDLFGRPGSSVSEAQERYTLLPQ